MGFYISDGDNIQQRINLSLYAAQIISSDITCFFENKQPSLSGFINTVLLNFCPDADASIGYTAYRLAEKYGNNIPDTIVNKDMELAYNTAVSYTSCKGIRIRLNNELKEYLSSDQCSENQFYDSLGQYLKAVLEEYARLAYFNREKIYFKQTLDTLTAQCRMHRIIKLRHINGDIFYVKPYKILTDSFSIYNYLIGLSRRSDEKEFRPASFRISRIASCSLMSSAARITKEQTANLEKQLSKSGVQFLIGTSTRTKVILTDTGMNMYNTILWLRPMYIEKSGNTLIFDCSPRQIFAYFLSFGKEAYIAEPASIREEMESFYENASRTFKS